jgi:regulator of replication initiation timing
VKKNTFSLLSLYVVNKKIGKATPKIAIKPSLEEQIDSLARLVMSNFISAEDLKKQLTYMQEENSTEFMFMRNELKDHRERLERIERKQIGGLGTLDETVHRSQFKSVVRRIEAL